MKDGIEIACEPFDMIPLGLFPIQSVIICGTAMTPVMAGVFHLPQRDCRRTTVYWLEEESRDG